MADFDGNYNQQNQKRAGFLSRTAKEVKNYKTTKKLLITALIMISIVLGTLYAVSALYKKSGSFTVSLDKFEMNQYKLSLSRRADISDPTSNLDAEIVKEMTNITEEDIPTNLHEHKGGEHNGAHYIAFTFFLQNAGENTISYEYSIKMSNISNGIDEAIRVKLYMDEQPPVVYAKLGADGNAEPRPAYPNEPTVPFLSVNTIAEGRVDSFAPQAVTKFTIVVWLEGHDRECIDYIIGGSMKIDMKINVVH